MRLEMGGVDHQLVGLTALGRQLGEDPVEHAQTAPADGPIVDRLVWAVTGRRITPAQSVPDHEDDAAHDPPVIDPRNAMRQREIRLDPEPRPIWDPSNEQNRMHRGSVGPI